MPLLQDVERLHDLRQGNAHYDCRGKTGGVLSVGKERLTACSEIFLNVQLRVNTFRLLFLTLRKETLQKYKSHGRYQSF